MLNVLELKRLLSDIPDNAIVYVEADHGQSSEQASRVLVTDEEFNDGKTPYYGENIDWVEIDELYDASNITAVLIQ